MMLSAFIGAGASLLGGILGNNAQRKAQAREAQAIREMNEYNDPKNVRARAEAAGFNPLLFIGPGVGQQTALPGISSANYLGSAIADAGMVIADQMAKNKELARLEKLSAENKKLAEKVQSLTIRPKVGGVYAQRGANNDRPAAESAGVGNDDISHTKLPNGLSYGSIKVAARSDVSDAETFEARYGDVAGSAIGLGILAADLGTAFRRYTDRKGWEAETVRRQKLIDNPSPRVPRWNSISITRPMFGGGF